MFELDDKQAFPVQGGMTKIQARRRFAEIVEEKGSVSVAAKLGCSVTQVLWVASGRRNPGLKIACAIEEAYKIPVKSWI